MVCYRRNVLLVSAAETVIPSELPNKTQITGYYPDGAFTVTETGWQNLSCKAGKDGYIDLVTNQSNATMLKCIQACEYPDSFVAAAYTPPPPASGDIFPSTYAGKRYLKPGATVTTTCKNITDGYYWNNEVDKNRVEVDHLITFVHKCKVREGENLGRWRI